MSISKSKVNLIFTILLALLFTWLAVEATTFNERAKYFPLYISIIALIFVIVDLVLSSIRFSRKKEGALPFHPHLLSALMYMGWMLLLLWFIYLVGFKVGSSAFLAAFLFFVTRWQWWKVIMAVIIAFSCMYLFGDIYMNLHWPANLMGW
ncbi:hypothetical protein [Virgibacillus ainsalahensis]